MKVEVSNGEILDKLSILEIKINNIEDKEKLANVKKEYKILKDTIGKPLWYKYVFRDHGFYSQLKKINGQLWVIEDDIRIKERNKEFDDEFIALARLVYQTNDERANIKKEINIYTGSELLEEKSYEEN